MNVECFRIYEALEAGALPVFVVEENSKPLLEHLSKWIPLLAADSWQKAAQTIHTLRAKPEVYEQVRLQMLVGWARLKSEVKERIRKVFQV
jgi:NADPH-dependent glutamate synthase beta subunit-like oxidoreductase